MVFNFFSKDLVRNALPTLPSGSGFRLYTGSTGANQVVNDNGTYPMIFILRQVGDLAILEDLDITTEAYKATLINDAEPNTNSEWWFSKNGGLTKHRVKILKKEDGQFGYFFVIYFQVQN